MKILLIDDFRAFTRQITNRLKNHEIKVYNLASDFTHDADQDKRDEFIQEADIFLLDFSLEDNEDILMSGIFSKILEIKKTEAQIAFISSFSKFELKENIDSFAQNVMKKPIKEQFEFLNKDVKSIVEFVDCESFDQKTPRQVECIEIVKSVESRENLDKIITIQQNKKSLCKKEGLLICVLVFSMFGIILTLSLISTWHGYIKLVPIVFFVSMYAICFALRKNRTIFRQKKTEKI